MEGRPHRILVMGTGRLAGTLSRASLRAPSLDEVAVMGRDPAARDRLVAANPGLGAGDPDFASRADLVVLAVAPQAYREVVEAIAPHLPRSAILVSVTNGVSLEEMGGWTSNPVVKVIPTIAQTVGRGATLVVPGPRATPADVASVTAWLGRFSLPVEIREIDSRVASNVAGSAVAILACFARAFLAANAKRAHAVGQASLDAMMAETLIAVGELARAGISFDEIVASTATPGGVTEAALQPLAGTIETVCRAMVEASFERQAELQAEKQ